MKRLLTNRGWGALQSPRRRAVNGLNLHPIGSWSAVQRLPKCRLPGYPSAGSQRFLPSGGPKTGAQDSLCTEQSRAQDRDRHRLLEQTVPVPSSTVLQEGHGSGTSKQAPSTPHPTFLRITHTPGQHVKFRNCHAHRELMKQAVDCAAWHTLRRDISRCLWISQTSKRIRRGGRGREVGSGCRP